jgi:hypothetical protein
MTTPEITTEMLNPGLTGTGWNAWPSLPVLEAMIIDPTDSYRVHQVGEMIGRSTTHRQVRCREIPSDIPIHRAYPGGWTGARGDMPSSALTNVKFVWAGPKGQEDSYEGRHILGVLDFPSKWISPNGRMELVGPAVVVKFGCEHAYETLTKRNCFIRQRCTICGHTYAVDSGD